ncbi:MAG: iron ABC transporter substrate-binding protein [SAR202 cluster bacterium]|nr:iron ABC transporter substrate-binding protein [SAR202 cluster bacterium]
MPAFHWKTHLAILALVVLGGLALGACQRDREKLVVYSGRTQSLVHPLLLQFAERTGIDIEVKYLSTSGVVVQLLEEGNASRADVVYLQDAGALGALAKRDMLAELPEGILRKVDSRFRSPSGEWVGISGRARTVVYNTERVNPETDLPDSILGFTAPEWRGRVGWSPLNGSFQAFVTAMRVTLGDDATREWLRGMMANDVRALPNNVTIVDAVARGEVDAGLVNHYYWFQFATERGADFGARNHFLGDSDIGALVNVAGVAVVKNSRNREAAERFVEFMLSEEAQDYFREETFEYPLAAGVRALDNVPPLEEIGSPDIDLSNLDDLEGTLNLLREVGAIL